MPKHVVLEFPVELPEEGLRDKGVLKKGKEAVVLELLRQDEFDKKREGRVR